MTEENTTCAAACREAGLAVGEVAGMTGRTRNTVTNWFNNDPALFKVVLAGCRAIKAESQEVAG